MTCEEAFVKVERLLWWHARRFVHRGLAGHGVTDEDVFGEAALLFCQRWTWFNGNPKLLSNYAFLMVRTAATVLRRANRKLPSFPLSAFKNPSNLAVDHRAGPGPEPVSDEVRRLLEALAELEPEQREEIRLFFGIGTERKHTLKELAERRGKGGITAAGMRVRKTVGKLRELLTP